MKAIREVVQGDLAEFVREAVMARKGSMAIRLPMDFEPAEEAEKSAR